MSDYARVTQALAAMQRQIDETREALSGLMLRREALAAELAAVDGQIGRIAGPLLAAVGLPAQAPAPPAPPPPAPPPEPPAEIAVVPALPPSFAMGPEAGTLQPPPSLAALARPSAEELREKVLQSLPPTTEEAIGHHELRSRLRSRGVPLDESMRKRLNRLLRELVSENMVVPRGEEGPDRRYQRNSSSPVAEAAAFAGVPAASP